MRGDKLDKSKSAPEEQIYNLIKDKIIKKELFPKSQVLELAEHL